MNAEELFNKGWDFWRQAYDEQDETQKRKKRMMAVSFLQQAINATANPPVGYFSILANDLYDLGEYDKAVEAANQALKIKRLNFRSYWVLYQIAKIDFEANGGFKPKIKKGGWGMVLLGAMLNPDYGGSVISDHLVNGTMSRGSGNALKDAYSGMLASFEADAKATQPNMSMVEWGARVLLAEAEIMVWVDYPTKPMYQTVIKCLSDIADGGEFENQIREHQAEAHGALSLLK